MSAPTPKGYENRQQGSAKQAPKPSDNVRKVPRTPNSADEVFGRIAEGVAYKVQQQPLGTQRPIKVIMLGGGASGINMAYQMRHHLPKVHFQAYEANPELSGTWYENRYPGCACDIPSATYAFAWAPNPNWSAYWVGAPEIKAYFLKAARDNDLEKYFKVNHRVLRAVWEEETSKWYLTMRVNNDPSTDFEDECDFFINGSGILNAWKWPDTPGLDDFKGTKVHSANWPEQLDLSGKRVGLIGVGSTATQLVPALQPIVEHLTCFARSKTWITPPIGLKYAGEGGKNVIYSDEQRAGFVADPSTYDQFRVNIETELNSRFKFLYKDSPEQKGVFDIFTNYMKKELADRPDLQEMLIPDFAVGCRRLTPGGGFLPALKQSNVVITNSNVERITSDSVITADGKEHKIDVLVCATGFDTSFKPRFEIRGRNGADLREQWTPSPQAYMSALVHNFPSYACIMGPGAPLAQGSMIPSTERIAEYIIQFIFRLATEPITSIEVTKEAEEDYWNHVSEQIKMMVWTSHCSSAFKNGSINGAIAGVHSGSRMHYFAMLERPRWEDMKFTYSNNRFAHLGNGLTTRETEGRLSTYYLLPKTMLKLQEY